MRELKLQHQRELSNMVRKDLLENANQKNEKLIIEIQNLKL